MTDGLQAGLRADVLVAFACLVVALVLLRPVTQRLASRVPQPS